MKKKGFTLVELLVAMAVLIILAGIGFSQFRNAQVKSRDAKRKSDAQAIIKALELYKTDTRNASFYPAYVTGCNNAVNQCLDETSLQDINPVPPQPPYSYLKTFVRDNFRDNTDYTYRSLTSAGLDCGPFTTSQHPQDAQADACTDYELIICLEWADDPSAVALTPPDECDTPAGAYNSKIIFTNP